MEPFTSLKFWRDSGSGPSDFHNNLADVRNRAPEKTNYDEDCDDESFFDLVFTKEDNNTVAIDSQSEKYLTIESPFKSTTAHGGEFTGKPQSPVTFLNVVVPKFRVLFLGFKKSKSARNRRIHESHGSFAVEEVQISSLFSISTTDNSKLQRESDSDYFPSGRKSPKYLKLIRASKRYFESPRISSDLSSSEYSSCSSPSTAVSISPPTISSEKRSAGGGIGALTKHLRKSRSVSSIPTALPPAASRRDDSLLLQNDGIQSAILHCKQSLNNTEYSSSSGKRQVA